jgi:alkylated DNA repair dioxygenase AlkB
MARTYLGLDQLPVKCVDYHPDFLPKELADVAVANLLQECKFRADEDSAIIMAGRKVNIPRKQVGYGSHDLQTGYKFIGIEVQGVPWSDSPTLEKIKDVVLAKTNAPINYCLVNWYRDGNDYIGFHSDDEKGLDANYPIISISLGAARPFHLRHKVTNVTYEQVLAHNSMVAMNPPCQRTYKHAVPKRLKIKKPRINLTFRVLRVKKSKKKKKKRV